MNTPDQEIAGLPVGVPFMRAAIHVPPLPICLVLLLYCSQQTSVVTSVREVHLDASGNLSERTLKCELAVAEGLLYCADFIASHQL